MKNKVKVIAEIGVNHNGSIKLAKKLIDCAKINGADYVKFQLFNAKELVIQNAKLVEYQKDKKYKNQYELLKNLELSPKDISKLFNYSKKKRIGFLTTPFDIISLNELIKMGVKNIKIASGEIDNTPLLHEISKKASTAILSTGMSDLSDIRYALKCLTKFKLKKKNITILHCTSNYPTKDSDVNLNCIKTIKNKFKINVGYSDHTQNILTGALAATLGSKIIEKHITLNRNLKGPDHKSSFEPDTFSQYVKLIRNVPLLMGKSLKKPNLVEIKTKKLVRKSIFAKFNIRRGEILDEKNLICKRPQSGISPKYWDKIIGKKAIKNFKTNQKIKIN